MNKKLIPCLLCIFILACVALLTHPCAAEPGSFFDMYGRDFIVDDSIADPLDVRTVLIDPEHPVSLLQYKKRMLYATAQAGGAMTSYRNKTNGRLKYRIGPQSQYGVSFLQPMGKAAVAAGYTKSSCSYALTLTLNSPVTDVNLKSDKLFVSLAYPFSPRLRGAYSFQNISGNGSGDAFMDPAAFNGNVPFQTLNITTRNSTNIHTLGAEYDLSPDWKAGALVSMSNARPELSAVSERNTLNAPVTTSGQWYEFYVNGRINRNLVGILDYRWGFTRGSGAVSLDNAYAGYGDGRYRFRFLREGIQYIAPSRRWDLSLMGANYRGNIRILGDLNLEPFVNIPGSLANYQSFTYLNSDTLTGALRTRLNDHFTLTGRLQNTWFITRSYLDSNIFLHAGLPRFAFGETAVDQDGKIFMASVGPTYTNKDLKINYTIGKYFTYRVRDNIERWRPPAPGTGRPLTGPLEYRGNPQKVINPNTSQFMHQVTIQYSF